MWHVTLRSDNMLSDCTLSHLSGRMEEFREAQNIPFLCPGGWMSSVIELSLMWEVYSSLLSPARYAQNEQNGQQISRVSQ